MAQTLTADVVIIGAGVAGLWLHHRLNQMGFNALLLENNSIGHAQTLSAQGIIHGGSKYALNGILSKASHAISSMPTRWRSCLAGHGDIDLSQVKLLANHQLLWSKQQLSSKMASFFASKALRSRMQRVRPENQPALFRHSGFNGDLYQLDEPVLDVPSVLEALVNPWQDRILKIPSAPVTWHYMQDTSTIDSIELSNGITIKAQQFILAAGEGNEQLLKSLGITKPTMQRRPLQMVLCKAKNTQYPLPSLYAHSLGSGAKPIATITSHFAEDGNTIWYIGGDIAEQGVGKSALQLAQEAKVLLSTIMPWYPLPDLDWATHAINRAEPKQSALARPDTAFVESRHNIHIAWPTKLALAPDLADRVITQLQKQHLRAEHHDNAPLLPKASISPPLWNRVFQ